MRILKLFFCASFLLARIAAAQWQVVSQTNETSASGIVEHRQALVENSANGARATIDAAIFSNKNATLRVLDNPTGADSLGEAMPREHGLAGVNGGYFDPNDAPVGLSISDGRMLAPFRKARLLSGVVTVLNGRVQIRRSAEFSMNKKLSAARQCGPFLVDGGKAIAGLNDTRAARRTFVATSANQRALIGFCSAVTLAQLADLLAAIELAPQTRIQRALNLDGGSSSAFWFDGAEGVFSIREQKTVRDFLAIVPQTARP
ncbi:MAG: phosphodiester glycosidase family protein [Chthoniobacterales bacterium]